MNRSPFRKGCPVFAYLVACLAISDGIKVEEAAGAGLPAPLLVDTATFTNKASAGHGYGHAVAMDGNVAAVGVDGGDPFASMHVFERSGTDWKEIGRISDSRVSTTDGFGYSVAAQNQTIVVGDIETESFTGSAYVYQRAEGPGLNAWNVMDGASSFIGPSYWVPLPESTQASLLTKAWRLSVNARLVHDLGGTYCMYFSYGNSTRRFLFFLDFSADGDLYADIPGSSPSAHPLALAGAGADDYHLHEIEFNPSSGMATYSFDGSVVTSWSGHLLGASPGVRWGAGSTAGRGAVNVNHVRFEELDSATVLAEYTAGTSASPVPDMNPLAQGWSQLNAGGSFTSAGPLTPDAATRWKLQARLMAAGGAALDQLGSSAALDGDTLVLGAPSRRGGGAAYVFVRQGAHWTEQQQLLPTPAVSSAGFGRGVAIDGDTIIVGAPTGGASPPPAKAYVFVRQGTSWTQQAVLAPVDSLQGRDFGKSVGIRGDSAVIGAASAGSGGAIYFTERTGTAWSSPKRIEPHPITSGEGFGASVSMSGETVVAGSSGIPVSYVFVRDGSDWVQTARRVYAGGDLVGDVDTDGETILAGVPVNNDGTIYFQAPDYSDPGLVAEYTDQLLYYSSARNGPFAPDHAAFRYKDLLYGQEAGHIRARFEMMDALYGADERKRSLEAEEVLWTALSLNPADALLGNRLLDLYYDRTAAEGILSASQLVEAERLRLGPPIAPPAEPGGFYIDREIPAYRGVLETNRAALKGYFDLLKRQLAIQQPGGGTSTDTQFGYQLFRDLVPTRELRAATYTNSSGMSVPVTTNVTLFTGYKDLVMLFNSLDEHGRAAETLARLLISRDSPGDRAAAETVIADAQRLLFVEGAFLTGIFPNLPPADDPSGLATALLGWDRALKALTTVEQLLDGGGNVLGFVDDFLMHVQKFTGVNQYFDSYDAFRARLDPTAGSNPLRSALDALQTARDSYADYRGFEDQLAEQFNGSSITYRDRLRDIVGVFPDDPTYGDKPTAHPGSELDQQFQSIEVAKLRIERNQTEIRNLRKQVEIEIKKAADISSVMIRFGEEQAQLTQTIGEIEALQAECNALAAAFSPEKIATGLGFVDIINGGAQGGLGIWKADLEADKERLAARQQAVITGIESDAVVKTLLLQMNTLAVDSREAALLYQQEVNRLVGLYREKEDLEQEIAEQDASRASRYFADPVHQLASQSSMVDARLAFEEARKWIFFMVRALEYKWNTPFRNYSFQGRVWSADTVFKLRNAAELELMYQAMDSFESQIQLPKDDYFDWFSVRDDFFGYKRTNNLGEVLLYDDPITGGSVDAITAFRSRLTQLRDAQGNVTLDFSTVTEIPGGTFFRGPRFNAQGHVISKGLFLDKIRWLKISLPGNHSLGRTQLTGELRYGGTGFIRNFDVGTYDPLRSDRLRNELTAYTTRFWFFHAPSATWRFNEALSSPVTMQLSEDPRVPPSVQEVDVFKERSVATTGWELTIPTLDAGQPVLNLQELDDVEIYFFHYAVTRP